MGAKISGSANQLLAAYLRSAPVGFELYSGDDRSAIDFACRGGAGIVSGISLVYPELFVRLTARLAVGEDVSDLQSMVDVAVNSLAGGDVGLIKLGLRMRGVETGPVRVSIEAPSRNQVVELERALSKVLG